MVVWLYEIAGFGDEMIWGIVR